MTILTKPETSPANPDFSSGPCAKRPGYDLTNLNNAVLGRSHRSKPGKSRLLEAITRTRDVLNVPDGWHIGIVPASMASNVLGLCTPRPVGERRNRYLASSAHHLSRGTVAHVSHAS